MEERERQKEPIISNFQLIGNDIFKKFKLHSFQKKHLKMLLQMNYFKEISLSLSHSLSLSLPSKA
jgi:hypothetical protein